MSISDLIVVMRDGILQQIDRPQEVYDEPANLFVAKFLGTPPINVFEGEVKNGMLYIGSSSVLCCDLSDRRVWVGVRPEGFVSQHAGPFGCTLEAIEVMGRDVSIIATHRACVGGTLRTIISSDTFPAIQEDTVRFALRPNKVFLFDRMTERRIPAEMY